MEPYYEHITVSVLLIITPGSGLFLSTVTGMAYYRLRKVLTPSFALLMMSLVVCDNLALAPMTFWAPTMTMLQDYNTSTSFIGRRVAHLPEIGWFASCYHILLIAVNRYMAISHPLKYRALFTTRRTAYMLLVAYVFSLLMTLNNLLDHLECNVVYYPSSYTWYYLTSDCTALWSNVTFYIGIATQALIAAITAMTVVKLRTAHVFNSEEQKAIELKFMKVSFVNIALYLVESILFHLPDIVEMDTWGLFICCHLLWAVCHNSNGVGNLLLVDSGRREVGKMLGVKGDAVEPVSIAPRSKVSRNTQI